MGPQGIQGATGSQGIPGPPGGSATIIEYTFSELTNLAPNPGQVRLNMVDQTQANLVWLSNTGASGVDFTDILPLFQAGTKLYIQDKDNLTDWQLYVMSSDAFNRGPYAEIGIDWSASSGAPLAEGRPVKVIFLTLGQPGPQGPQGVAGLPQTIQDEGTTLTGRTIMNFTGGGVTAADNGVSIDVAIPGQTPWLQHIDAGGFDLTNLGNLAFNHLDGGDTVSIVNSSLANRGIYMNHLGTGHVAEVRDNGTEVFRIDSGGAVVILGPYYIINTTELTGGAFYIGRSLSESIQVGVSPDVFAPTGYALVRYPKSTTGYMEVWHPAAGNLLRLGVHVISVGPPAVLVPLVCLPSLPTSAAGLPTGVGALWVDTAAGRVIKSVA